MIFLHGFGQNYKAFESLYEKLEGQFNFLALHIFFHGESILEGNKPLGMDEWADLIKALFAKLEIENAHWVGFSMGAKFTMATFQRFPEGFQSISLFAPDGLVMNPWYRLATQTFPGRGAMIILLKYLPVLRYLVWLMSKIGIIPKSLGRFVESQLNTSEQREQVLDTWLFFRKIWPEAKVWHPHLNRLSLPLQVVLGKRDTVIPPKKFKSFKNRYPGINWIELKAGHSSLLDKWAEGL